MIFCDKNRLVIQKPSHGSGEPATADGGSGKPLPKLNASTSTMLKFERARLKLTAMKGIGVIQTEAQARPRLIFIKGACVPLNNEHDYGALDVTGAAAANGAVVATMKLEIARKKTRKTHSLKAWGALRSGVVTEDAAADEDDDHEPSGAEPGEEDAEEEETRRRRAQIALMKKVNRAMPNNAEKVQYDALFDMGGIAKTALRHEQRQARRCSHASGRPARACTRLVRPNDRIAWDVFLMMLLIYLFVMIPYRMGFNVEARGPALAAELAMDCCFLFDVLLNFCTSIVDEDENEVTDPRVLAWQYGTGWFWIDFPSSVPWSAVLHSSGLSTFARGAKILKISKALKVFKLMRMSMLLQPGT